jgi:hypothetical protein
VDAVEENGPAFGLPMTIVDEKRRARDLILKQSPFGNTSLRQLPRSVRELESLNCHLEYMKQVGWIEMTVLSGDDHQIKITALGITEREKPEAPNIGLRLDAEPVRTMMDDLGLVEAGAHLAEAQSGRLQGSFSGSNSQVRSSLESMFNEYAKRMLVDCHATGGAARKKLQNAGHMSEEEGKWVQGVMAFCGNRGSHAGVADDTDNLVKLAAGLGVAAHFLLKWGDGSKDGRT